MVSPTITAPSAPAVFIFDLILVRIASASASPSSERVHSSRHRVPVRRSLTRQISSPRDRSVTSGQLGGSPSDQRIVAHHERHIRSVRRA